jgi:hypothetical protein
MGDPGIAQGPRGRGDLSHPHWVMHTAGAMPTIGDDQDEPAPRSCVVHSSGSKMVADGGHGPGQKEVAVTLGPLEYIVIGFEGNRFDGSIAREIEKVVEKKIIRLVDVVFVGRDAEGNEIILELDNKDDPRFSAFSHLLGDSMALLTPEDLVDVAAMMPANTSGLVLLFEHRWAEDIKDAIIDAGGFLVTRAVVPPEVLEEVSRELDAAS